MPSETEIAWLAGLLEGEGSFGAYGGPKRRPGLRVYIEMTDEDVVVRAASVMRSIGATKSNIGCRDWSKTTMSDAGKNRDFDRWNKSYYFQVRGQLAEDVMRLVRPYVGTRRTAKIDELLAFQGYSHHPSDRKATVSS